MCKFHICNFLLSYFVNFIVNQFQRNMLIIHINEKNVVIWALFCHEQEPTMYSWESPPQRLRCEPTMYFKLTYQHSHPGIQNAFLSILDVTEASNSQKESHIWGCKMQNFLHFATIRFTKRAAHYYFILPPIILISQEEQRMGCGVYWSLHFYACSCFQLPW